MKKETKKTNMLVAAFMMFIFPIMFVFLGVFLGGYIGKAIGVHVQTYQIAGGIVAFVISVVLIKLFDRSAVVDENAEKIYWEDL